ncbi:MAG: EamA family transporter, partial [Candidatus Limnocylindria bacterium]
MQESANRLNWLIFMALGVMWGSSYLFIKIGVETLTPLTLVAL